MQPAGPPLPLLLMLLMLLLHLASSLPARPPADLILLARCHSLCSEEPHSVKRQCVKKCEEDITEKPGVCPTEAPPLSLGCIKECTVDGNCPDVLKCCQHSCGVTCQPPLKIDIISGLPTMPSGVFVTVRRKSKSATINWQHGNLGDGEYYVVEERHGMGLELKDSVLGEWGPLHKSPRNAPPIKASFKPGNWYQVRVAAVNQNGSRGFSEPSKPFKLFVPPRKPDPPKNLSFGSATHKNGSVSVVISWEPPNSDIPVSKYTVFWTRRIATKETPPIEGSAFVLQKTINHEKTSLRIRKLIPNVLYFIQVQAQAQYGKDRFMSDRASLVLNTSYAALESSMEKTVKGKNIQVRMDKLQVVNGNLTTKIFWKARMNMTYGITLQSSCGQESKTVILVGSYFDLPNLQFECSYNIFLREKSPGRKGKRTGRISFTTPPCSQVSS